MKWAIKIRYLDSDTGKWKRHTTKWHDNSADAWDEADKFERHIKWDEMSRGLAHKNQRA